MLKYDFPPGYGSCNIRKKISLKSEETLDLQPLETRAIRDKKRWMEWLYWLEKTHYVKCNKFQEFDSLQYVLSKLASSARKKALVLLARNEGFSKRSISEHTGISRFTIRHYLSEYEVKGIDFFHVKKSRPKKFDDEKFRKWR